MFKQGKKILATSLVVFLLYSCSEGGGITGTGFDDQTVGVITGFGSVFVNGIKFETTGSKVTLDDVVGLESQLKIGMVVNIFGTIDPDGTTGTAGHIIFADDVEGTVLANNVVTNDTLDIMGQTIHVSAETKFESNISVVSSIEQIQVGNVVEVSGFNLGDGNINATRVEVKTAAYTAGDEIEVTGTIKDTTSTTFKLGELVVRYDQAEFDDIPNNTLVNGLFVEVKSKQGFNDQNQLIANEVELEGDGIKKYEIEEGQEIKLEGIVIDFSEAAQTFTINGQTISFNSNTHYDPEGSQLKNGDKVVVEGEIDAPGVLLAEEIKVATESNTTLSGYVQAVDTINNTFTVFDKLVNVTATTSFDDERDDGHTPERRMNVNKLDEGNFVELSVFYTSASDNFTATSVERDDPEDSEDDMPIVEIEGEVSEIITPSAEIKVSGILIDISQLSEFNPEIGDRVEIEGVYIDMVIIAGEESEISEVSEKPETSDTSEEPEEPEDSEEE